MKKVFLLTLLAVCLFNLILWTVLDPVGQNEVATIGSVFFFNRIFAVIATLVEAVLIALKVSELCGIKTRNDKSDGNEKSNKDRNRLIRQLLIIIILAALVMTICRFSYQKIDDKGYTFLSPINQYTYLWEDMEYYADYSTDFGGRTYVKFSKVDHVSGIILDDEADLNLRLFRFKRLTNAAKVEFKTEEDFLNDIFLNKYGHLEAKWGGKGIGYVLKNDIK